MVVGHRHTGVFGGGGGWVEAEKRRERERERETVNKIASCLLFWRPSNSLLSFIDRQFKFAHCLAIQSKRYQVSLSIQPLPTLSLWILSQRWSLAKGSVEKAAVQWQPYLGPFV